MQMLTAGFGGLVWTVVIVLLVALHRANRGGALVPAAALAGWFALTYALAASGVLAQFELLPPRGPMLAFGLVAVGVAASRVAAVQTALRQLPDWAPVALQTFRAPLELLLYLLFLQGQVPEQMTFEGRNFDVLVGLSAPVMAFLMWRGAAPRWLQWAWQVGAVALLVNVVGIAVSSAPGPLHRDWPGAPFTLVAQWPFALLPAFLVPMAALGHVAAIARLVRRTSG